MLKRDLLFCHLILSNVTSCSLTLSQILTHHQGLSSGKGERAYQMREQLSWLESWQGVRGVCLNQRDLSCCTEKLLKARMQGGLLCYCLLQGGAASSPGGLVFKT